MSETNEITFEMANGLLPCSARDYELQAETQAAARPITSIPFDVDNEKKVITYDDAFKKFLRLLQAEIARDWESYLPWNAYKELNCNWVNGYNFSQQSGDCTGNAAKNSLKISGLTLGKILGKAPREIYLEMTYAIARGDGTPNWGKGLNLEPMSSYSASAGNFLASDLGGYDCGKKATSAYLKKEYIDNALTLQSVICPLSQYDFDVFFEICSAGLGIEVGSSVFPSSASLNKDGLSVPTSRSTGGHATCFGAACVRSGTKYLYWENSHGFRYGADSFNPNKQSGCWIDETEFSRFKFSTTYGLPYVNIGEFLTKDFIK